MPESVPMTQEGHAKLRAEREDLERRRPEIKKAIEEAREKGDLRENADYHAAREELGMLNARIEQIEGMLARAQIVDPSKAPAGTAVLGSTVTFKRVKDGQEMTRILVGAGQADPTTGKILTTSPIGQALVGHQIGEVVVAQLPGGPMELKIVKIE